MLLLNLPALSLLLSPCSFVLQVCNIFTCALPTPVENPALVVLGL
jgi:hypothetical protein